MLQWAKPQKHTVVTCVCLSVRLYVCLSVCLSRSCFFMTVPKCTHVLPVLLSLLFTEILYGYTCCYSTCPASSHVSAAKWTNLVHNMTLALVTCHKHQGDTGIEFDFYPSFTSVSRCQHSTNQICQKFDSIWPVKGRLLSLMLHYAHSASITLWSRLYKTCSSQNRRIKMSFL